MQVYCVAQEEELAAEVVAGLVGVEVAGGWQNLGGEGVLAGKIHEKWVYRVRSDFLQGKEWNSKKKDKDSSAMTTLASQCLC